MSESWVSRDGWPVPTPCAPLGREALLRSVAPALGVAVDGGLPETYVDVVIEEAVGYDDEVVAAAVERALPAVGTMSVDRWADALAALLFHHDLPGEAGPGAPDGPDGPPARCVIAEPPMTAEPAVTPELASGVRGRLAAITARPAATRAPESAAGCDTTTTTGAAAAIPPGVVTATDVVTDRASTPVTTPKTTPTGDDDAGPGGSTWSGRLLVVAVVLGARRTRRASGACPATAALPDPPGRRREAARTNGRCSARAPPPPARPERSPSATPSRPGSGRSPPVCSAPRTNPTGGRATDLPGDVNGQPQLHSDEGVCSRGSASPDDHARRRVRARRRSCAESFVPGRNLPQEGEGSLRAASPHVGAGRPAPAQEPSWRRRPRIGA